MKNREVFHKDPATLTLLNNGVAKVADVESAEQLRTLRFELTTFVCEGEYERGLCVILETFLKNLGKEKPEQPAVWVSGFYGSGKSHLVKMLRYFWVDFPFPEDGATAQGLAHLTQPVKDHLKELTIAGKKFGLHAASGTLGAAARGNVRLGLLSIIFRSAGLPAEYYKARFVMWLKAKKLLEAVEASLQKAGTTLAEELQDMYVSPPLANALLAAEYPKVTDVSIDDMVTGIRKALTVGKKFPCTLLALDEIQQQIGEGADAADRAYEIQEIAQACSERFEGKLILVGTGQSALSGTPLLQKLLGRFPVQINLLDTDVEAVTRKMVLAKKPDKNQAIAEVFAQAQHEVPRHLKGTQIEPRSEDHQIFVVDYPLLPVRRRFWERCLRAVDKGGTAAQLRSQLRIVLEAVQENADKPLGHVIPADVLFDQKSSEMRQTGVLLAEIHERILKLKDGTPDGLLKSRMCALIFLINKLPRETGADLGIRANADVLADLLVEDLKSGGNALRMQIPQLLTKLTQDGVLMPVGDEYRLQTTESTAWNRDYQQRFGDLHSDGSWLSNKISEVLSQQCQERLKDVKRVTQGDSKEPRKLEFFFGAEKPSSDEGTLPVWIRNGWTDTENAVRVDALKDSTDSPTIYAYIQKVADADLKKALASHQAARETLDARGTPSTDAGREAQSALETRLKAAESDVKAAVDQIFQTALVFQAGSNNDVNGTDLANKIEEAADTSLTRLYPQFGMGDNPKWDTVITRAKGGAADPLKPLDYDSDTKSHPVCSKVVAFVGKGKKGADVRNHFGGKGYGWPKDTIDGALLALCAAGNMRCSFQSKKLEVKQIERTKINQCDFQAEDIELIVPQKLAIRGLFQETVGLNCKPNEEANVATQFIHALRDLAAKAGGAAPLPAAQETKHLEEIAGQAGNAKLMELFNRREQLKVEAKTWRSNAELVAKRLPRWSELERLLHHAAGLPVHAEVKPQVDAICEHRSLLASPDPVPPLCHALTEAMRTCLVQAHAEFKKVHEKQMLDLTSAPVWQQLQENQRTELLAHFDLNNIPAIQTGTEAELIASLDRRPLNQWSTLRDALPQRFQNALVGAAKRLEPEAVPIDLPHATFKKIEDFDAWAAQVRQEVQKKLDEKPPRPVIV
ncbi:MAG: BREX system P-loop protein BrxC, partial [Planctomycetia bacterium]|nr:BREX system P-loop protein BrxC [Planctomycetia bacterium]